MPGNMVMIDPTMGLLDSIRRLFGRAEDAMNEVDYAALDAVHHAEDRIDERPAAGTTTRSRRRTRRR